MKIYLKIIFALIYLSPAFSGGQNVDLQNKKQQPDIFTPGTEQLLLQYGDSILKASTDSSRSANNLLFHEMMDSIVQQQQSFDHDFSELKNLSVLSSDNHKVRVYSWMVPSISKMEYDFFGYVQVLNDKKKMKVYTLKEKKYFKNDESEFLRLNDTCWFGALYYKLIRKTFDNKDQYILLGWQGKDIFSTRKVMDCLSVSPTKIEFGKPVFKSTGKAKSRVILEYNSQASVSMNYNAGADMIIQDHLSPSDPRPEAKGMFSLYGPDLSYDGWKFKEGLWYLQKNVVIKNKRDNTEKKVKLRHDLRLQRKEE